MPEFFVKIYPDVEGTGKEERIRRFACFLRKASGVQVPAGMWYNEKRSSSL